MKRKLIFLLVLCAFFVNKAVAQINESDNLLFQLRISTTGNYQMGNVNIFTLRNKLELSFRPFEHLVVKSQNANLYQEISRRKVDFDIFSRNYVYYKPEKNLYPYIIGYISSNFRRKIENRYFTGAGITYQLVKKTNHNLKISVNSVYEKTNYSASVFNYPEFNGMDTRELWRGTIYLSGFNYFLDRKLKVFYDAYHQPSFSDEKDYRVQFEAGLEFFVYKGLSLNTLYSFNHEHIVPQNIKQDDKILTFGLAYNFKKE